MDEVTNILKSLSARMERLELEGKQYIKIPKMLTTEAISGGQITMFLRVCQGKKGAEIEMIRKSRPLSKITLLIDEERGEEELDPEIHCIGDTSPFPHLTQSAYEEYLMNIQINELSKGEKANSSSPNKYNLRSKKKEVKSDIPDHPLIAENPAKPATITAKERNT
jgi:hypothetical protein